MVLTICNKFSDQTEFLNYNENINKNNFTCVFFTLEITFGIIYRERDPVIMSDF